MDQQSVVTPPSPPISPEQAPPQPTPPWCFSPKVVCDSTCTDLESDPENCGACGNACASGLCEAGACVGSTTGHVIAIGHDYEMQDAAMDRVLADAVGLATGAVTRIGYWRGSSKLEGAQAAAVAGLAQTGRTAATTELAGLTASDFTEIDTLVIEPQTGSDAEATGAAAAQALADFLAARHVVVVLETAGGTSYQLAAGAGLFSVSAPVDASNTDVSVAQPADAVAQGVPSPYLGRASTVGYPGVANPVFVDGAGDAVVFHLTY
jgi:hypothetical protein